MLRHLKELSATFFVVVGLPVLLTGAVAEGRTPHRPEALAPSSFRQFVIARDAPTAEPPVFAVEFPTATSQPVLIVEPALGRMPLPSRPVVKQPAPKARVLIKKPKPRSIKRPVMHGGSVSGVATWYCLPGQSVCTHGYSSEGAYAAAGPELRAALGPHYKGKVVWVNGVRVTLADFCACGGDRVIDVYHSTWVKIPHPNNVTVRW